ncbi:putative GTPase PH0274 [Frankia sp. AiPs1]|uniref:methylmalonyl Co-A mutase-associated GTPase MeaB n=1 Tax=Frankia sp. AiPa1 TaxID=573492 RepID=UPI00202AEE5A|nr:methylmalonyl Co-A mutase-associated GTPase MeaB [Frankia sp. AiPa1]MCL9761098.1 methylmalonyl Co-A mutase-associated GTPase MeaB [Frankia sp. AiPa1]
MTADAEVARLVTAALGGDRRSVARLLSLAENDPSSWPALGVALAPHTGGAQIVGLTGPPGVGKSTTTAALARAFRDAGRRVGVLAVDPSSPVTGGALLGDRIRMSELAGDQSIFVRSLASRGHLGGLATVTAQALRILDAAGYDLLLVETVGVGQAEVDIASIADTTCLLLAPGAGDGVQAVKAGLLEVADILVVNKTDQPGAARTVADLTAMLRLRAAPGLAGSSTSSTTGSPRAGSSGAGPSGAGSAGARSTGAGFTEAGSGVVRLAAARGEGIDSLVERITAHYRDLAVTGELDRRRVTRAAAEVRTLALAILRTRLETAQSEACLRELANAVAAGTADPVSAAHRLLAALA